MSKKKVIPEWDRGDFNPDSKDYQIQHRLEMAEHGEFLRLRDEKKGINTFRDEFKDHGTPKPSTLSFMDSVRANMEEDGDTRAASLMEDRINRY
jgi:hypothetical protein